MERLDGIRVVVVDDEPDALALAATILRTAGAKVRAVASAEELWRCFDDYCPHVVVSDIHMPGISGIDLVKEMRSRKAIEGGLTGTIALTALAQKEQRVSGLRAGFDCYLTKPVDVAVLVHEVARLGRA